MSRSSDGGTGNRILVYPMERSTTESPWSLMSYPRPDPGLIKDDEREMTTVNERLYWRDSGIMAYAPGHPHPVDEESELITRDQFNNPPPPKRPRGRPKKIREEAE